MNIRNTTLSLFLLLSVNTFSQDSLNQFKKETKHSYLDSIKSSFVHDKIASCVDSLWMKELTNTDIYTDLATDIKTINIDEKVDYELSTELLKERLAEMDAKSPFNIEYNQGLENIIKSFLKNRKKSFERLMAISEYYFPLFEEAMANQNVPLEIKYLAVVESALNPKAVSRVGATGLWQFMYHTGKQYNLNINSYVDERSDVLKASDAAAQYMSNMYKIFGDWDLVLASYNSGPGNVAKAIRRSGGHQNFWNIRKHLPKETQGYVPAFLATMYIYEYHKEHGIVPNKAIIKHFETDTIAVRKQISFKQISDLLDVPMAQLHLLNPSYKRDVVPFVAGEAHYLRLPTDKIAVFTSNEDKIYAYVQHEAGKRERPYNYQRGIASRDSIKSKPEVIDPAFVYHKVKRGDNLNNIAIKYAVSVDEIKTLNNLKNNALSFGKKLKVKSKDALSNSPIVEEKNVVSVVSSTKNYKVKNGDNLGAIAEKFEVSVVDIKKWNKLKSNNISVGDNIKIVTQERVAAKSRKDIKSDKNDIVAVNDSKNTDKSIVTDNQQNTPTDFYVVQAGDNLSTIARKFNVSVDELKNKNNLTDNNIKLGAKLIITNNQVDTEKAVVATFDNQEYTVVQGDNILNIAKKFKVSTSEIKEWNQLKDNNIQIGTKLVVAKNQSIASNDIASKNTTKGNSNKNAENYYVKHGDSLFSIAKKFKVTTTDIKQWNNINNENLKPGMKLKING